MKKPLYLFLTLFIISTAIFLTQCSPAPTDVANETILATATPDTAVYQSLIQQSQAAYDSADFEDAMDLAKQAAAIKPGDNTAWSLFQDAAVADAGDQYLRNLPARRYRKNSEQFLADVSNGMLYFIIDVREPDEFAGGHIENAVNIPLRQLVQNIAQLPDSKTHPILIYCHTQKRATHGLVVMRELGYTNVFNLEGGWVDYEAWTAVNPMPTPGPTATPETEPPSC